MSERGIVVEFFQSEERTEAEDAAIKFYRALERIGVELYDIHIDEPCARCVGASKERGIRVALGDLGVDDVRKYADIIERLTKSAKL